MSLLDDIASLTQTPGTRCTIPALIASLAPEDAEDLRTAFADPSIPGAAIARALDKRGHRVAHSTIQRHRRRECQCP